MKLAKRLMMRPSSAMWTPADDTSDMWLDYSDAATLTIVSGKVSQWADKSGNGRNAVMGTDSLRPLAGLYGVEFNGSTYFGISSPISMPSSFACFAVVTPTSSATYRSVVGASQIGGPHFRLTNAHKVGVVVASKYEVIESDVYANIGQKNIIGCFLRDSGKSVYVNGVEKYQTGSTTFSSTLGYVGASIAAGEKFLGVIHELVVKGATTTDYISKIHQYFAQKWSVSL